MKIIDGKIHIYDIDLDLLRELRPDDVVSLESVYAAFGMLRTKLQKLFFERSPPIVDSYAQDCVRELLAQTLLVGQGKANINDFPE
jgi:hypothetical protein